MAAFDKLKSKYKAGQYVFKDGDLGTEMYTVSAGRIALIKEVSGREIVIATMEKGDFFGEMAVLESLPRNLSARVEDDGTELIAINGSTFDKMIKSNIEIAVRMLRKFSTRLREADADALRLREKCQALEQEVTAFAARPAMAPVVVPAASPTPAAQPQPTAKHQAPARPPTPAPAPVAPVTPLPVPEPAPAPAPRPVARPRPAPAPAAPPPTPPPASPPAQPRALLTIKGSDKTIRLSAEEATVGRADPVTGLRPDVDLTVEDLNRFISRRHAKIIFRDGVYYLVEEVGVTNGTYVNGKRLQAGVYTPIHFGDELCFGKVFLHFEKDK